MSDPNLVHHDGRNHTRGRERDVRCLTGTHQQDGNARSHSRKALDGSHVSGKKKAGAPAMTGSVTCESPRRKSSDRALERSRPVEKEKSLGRSRPIKKETPRGLAFPFHIFN